MFERRKWLRNCFADGCVNDKAEEELLFKVMLWGSAGIELQSARQAQEDAEDALIDLAYKHDIPLVATNDAYFMQRKGYQAHDALPCIAEGRYAWRG